MRPVHGFFILDKSGVPRFSRTYRGDPLDRSLVAGFFSSVTSFASSLAGESLRSVTLSGTRFAVRETGGFLLVAHGPSRSVSQAIERVVREAEALVSFLLGPPSSWAETLPELRGLEDLVDAVFTSMSQDDAAAENAALDAYAPGKGAAGKAGKAGDSGGWERSRRHRGGGSPALRALVGGVERVLLEGVTRDQLDRVMASLEDADSVRSSVLLLGDFVLHSRLPAAETHIVQFLLSARPMGVATSRRFPAHVQSSWMQLLATRLGGYTLVLLTSADAAQAEVAAAVRGFDATLHESGLRLPVEPPPVLLRHFAPRDVVAFVYHNTRSGTTIAPSPRPFNEQEEREIIEVVSWLYSRARFLLDEDKTPSVLLRHDGLWFHAVCVDNDEIYVLYSGHAGPNAVEATTRDLLYTATSFA